MSESRRLFESTLGHRYFDSLTSIDCRLCPDYIVSALEEWILVFSHYDERVIAVSLCYCHLSLFVCLLRGSKSGSLPRWKD